MRVRAVRWATVAVGLAVALVLLVPLLGWLGDKLAVRKARQLSEESLEYFSEFRRVGYQKPVFYDGMVEGNAWELYAKGVAILDTLPIDFKLVDQFLSDRSEDTAEVAQFLALTDLPEAIEYVKQGARRKRCTAPFDFDPDEFWMAEYKGLGYLALMMALRIRLSAGEDPASALEDVKDCLVFAEDVAGGYPVLLGSWACMRVLSRYPLREAHRVMSRSQLKENELEEVARTMNSFIENLPAVSVNVDADWRMQIILDADLAPLEVCRRHSARRGAEFYRGEMLFGQLTLWRDGFSLRRAYIGSVHLRREIIDDLRSKEENWASLDSTLDYWTLREKKYYNYVQSKFFPTHEMAGLYAERNLRVAEMTLAGAAALIQLHFLEHGHWPQNLQEIECGELGKLLVDPITREELKYVIYPEGDSVSVYSLGLNMSDDVKFPQHRLWDIVLTLHRPH